MRELSHQKGKDYQGAVKRWLTDRPFLGLTTGSFGDAYDASKAATRVGQKYFDLSLKLMDAAHTRRILYVECKYRRETYGTADREFDKFIDTVYSAINTEPDSDTTEAAEFCFVSNIPPRNWRSFLRGG